MSEIAPLLENNKKKTFGERLSGIKKSFRSAFTRIKDFIVRTGKDMETGAAAGLLFAVLLYAVTMGYVVNTGLGLVIDILLSLIMFTLLILLSVVLARLLLKIIKSLPSGFTSIVIAVIAAFSIQGTILFGYPFLMLELTAGALIGYAFKRGIYKPVSLVLAAVAVAANILFYFILTAEGEDPFQYKAFSSVHFLKETVSAPDPSLKGPYNTKMLYYGSGWDKREEYGKKAELKTPDFDASSFLPETDGLMNTIRRWYWGFDVRNLPLNAIVWYPDGKGPFPLVLIVHGNHKMEEYSEPGYEYLGRHLSSKGFIVASVDENFLNGNWINDYGQNENLTRGLLLLEHLKQWRKWNSKEGNPFFNKVDMNNIALIGHSRGGQAVAIAAAMNKMERYHVDARKKFDYNFNLKSIIQIAPNDAYNPTNGNPLFLRNINYLVLQGAYDSDVSLFLGIRQYNRISFSDSSYHFKSLVYIYRANHGQFNTVWGRHDYGKPWAWLLNVKPLMKAEEQQKIAKVYVASFLEATLLKKKEYLPVFKNPKFAAAWLPDDIYKSQFEDSESNILAGYDEDFNPSTGSKSGVKIEGDNLSVWSENALSLRDKWATSQHTNVVYLGWDKKDKDTAFASYSVILPDNSFGPAPEGSLTFTAANNKEDKDSVNFTIELVSKNGTKADMEFSRFGMMIPPLKSKIAKWEFLKDMGIKSTAERIPQYFELPLKEFLKASPSLDLKNLKEIRFIFNRVKSGEIILDNVGFRKAG